MSTFSKPIIKQDAEKEWCLLLTMNTLAENRTRNMNTYQCLCRTLKISLPELLLYEESSGFENLHGLILTAYNIVFISSYLF